MTTAQSFKKLQGFFTEKFQKKAKKELGYTRRLPTEWNFIMCLSISQNFGLRVMNLEKFKNAWRMLNDQQRHAVKAVGRGRDMIGLYNTILDAQELTYRCPRIYSKVFNAMTDTLIEHLTIMSEEERVSCFEFEHSSEMIKARKKAEQYRKHLISKMDIKKSLGLSGLGRTENEEEKNK